MAKKLIFFLFSGLILFLGITSIVFKSPAYAEKCPNNNNELFVIVTTPFVKSTGTVHVGYTAQDNNNYDLYVLSDDLEDTLMHRDLDNRKKGSSYEESIDLTKSGFTVKIDASYVVQIRDHNANKCGQSGFTVNTSGTPPKIEFWSGSPKSRYTQEEIGTTLPRVAVSGVTPGEVYKFALSGRWDGSWLREKGGRGPDFTADTNAIIVENICENGEGNRTNCEENFRAGNYVIELQLASNSQFLASADFRVSSPTEDIDPTKVPGLTTGTSKDVNEVASGFASTFLSFGIGIAGGIAFLLMVFGSYRLMFAGGNPESIQQGREVITAAIAGLLVIVFAMFILRFLGYTILGLGGL